MALQGLGIGVKPGLKSREVPVSFSLWRLHEIHQIRSPHAFKARCNCGVYRSAGFTG